VVYIIILIRNKEIIWKTLKTKRKNYGITIATASFVQLQVLY